MVKCSFPYSSVTHPIGYYLQPRHHSSTLPYKSYYVTSRPINYLVVVRFCIEIRSVEPENSIDLLPQIH